MVNKHIYFLSFVGQNGKDFISRFQFVYSETISGIVS